jgi:ABC-type cobalamin/Fe3+-siderophores transport system ATPase subunit
MGNGSLSASINADVLSWAKNQLAQWQHDALRRILSKGQLAESDYVEILQRAQFDLGMAVSPVALVELTLTTADLPTLPPSKGRVILKALRSVENVNSLKTGTTVTFGPQLTVIYGENGSGKSGYARILKRVGRCASRAVEAILPNVYASPTTNVARAILDVEVAGSPSALSWSDGQQPLDELRHIAVFDSKCALSYLGADNQVSFVPSVIDALRLLSDATDEIKRRLAAVAAAAAPPYPAVLVALTDTNTNVGRALSLLSPATDPRMLIGLAKWHTNLDEKALVAKQAQLAELRTLSPALRQAKVRSANQSLASLLAIVERVSAALEASKVDALRQYDREFVASSEAYQTVVQSALGDSRIVGVGTDAWRSLLDAAYRFSTVHAYEGQPFPPTSAGAVCVLCQQTLTPDATSRLTKFWSFLKDDATARKDLTRDTRDRALAEMRTALDSVPTELARLESELAAHEPDLWKAATDFFASAEKRISATEESLNSRTWDGVPPLDITVREACASKLAAGEAKSGPTSGDGEVEGDTAALTIEVAELTARKRLAASLQLVQDYLGELKHHTALKAAADSIATTGITFKAKSLYGTHVTAAFRRRVAQNMQHLGLQRAGIAIEEKSGKGKVLHTIKLDGAKVAAQPSAVLSEGERTAISLSFFLADLGSADETSVVVLDDPVTSLDHRIREGALKALIAEAKDRQIVVFTHDLAFFHELVSRAHVEQTDVVTQYVESFDHAVGVIQGSTPWDAMVVKERIVELTKHITKANDANAAADGEAYEQQVNRFYSRLRATWERSVEEVLFNEVVSRYERAVQTMRLAGVTVDKEGITTIFEGMTRCSAITDAHDHAAAATVPTPTTADMMRDLGALQEFVKSQKVKRNAAEKANAHLKA